jgi:hypothetical protein
MMTLLVFATTVSAHAEQGTGSVAALLNADRTVAIESSSVSDPQLEPANASKTTDTVPNFVTNDLVMT